MGVSLGGWGDWFGGVRLGGKRVYGLAWVSWRQVQRIENCFKVDLMMNSVLKYHFESLLGFERYSKCKIYKKVFCNSSESKVIVFKKFQKFDLLKEVQIGVIRAKLQKKIIIAHNIFHKSFI